MTSSRGQLYFGLVLCYAAMMCLAISVNLPPILLTTLGVETGGPVGLTLEQLGRIGSAIFAGATIGILGCGPLADRWGAKPFAVAANAMIGLGLALLASAHEYRTVLLAVFVMGLGAGILDMVLSPIVNAMQPHMRSAAMNRLHSFYCIGAVATVLAGEWALKHGLGWRAISVCLIVVPALIGAGFLFMKVPALFSEQHGRTRLRQLCRQRFFAAALAAMFLIGASELAMVQWLPAYAEKGLGLSRWVGGMALLVYSAAMAAGRIGVGVIGHRVSAFRIMIACSAGLMVLVLVGAFAPRPVVALSACMAAGLAVSCLWPSMLAVASDRFPQGGASLFAILGATGNFGGLIMPWVVGATAYVSTLSVGLATIAVCPLLLVVLLFRMSASNQ